MGGIGWDGREKNPCDDRSFVVCLFAVGGASAATGLDPGGFAKRNNSVIRGTNTVSRTFTLNDVMEVAMRTYILAIATAALFAIPTAPAFSESGHHRYYNRYEGLYDRYESERCRELRAACTHKEKLGEQVMGNCRRFRELCD